jgi:hypothetical protein
MPPIHELASQAGIELPNYLGSIMPQEEKTTKAVETTEDEKEA